MKGIDEFYKALKDAPRQKLAVIEYRVYHTGTKVLYAVSNPADAEWPEGDSIVISKKMYKEMAGPLHYKVMKGKLVQVRAQDGSKIQLERAKNGKFTSLPNNIIFAAEKGDNYIQTEYDDDEIYDASE